MVEEQPASRIPPFLLGALVCDIAATDPSTGKTSLVGIFDLINVGKFPAARPMSLYLRLTDAEGHYPMRVDFVHAEKDALIARVEGALNAPDRTVSMDAHFEFPPLPIPEAGRYEFRIYASDMYLGGVALVARLRPR